MRPPAGLLAITPGQCRDALDVERLLGQLGSAFEAGLRAVSIREPGLSDALLLELANKTVELAARSGPAWVGVHDSLHVALASRADGVHLGFRSLSARAARQAAGARLAIGFSAHERDDPSGEAIEGVDYVTFGPVRETPSKAGLLEPCGLEGLERFVRDAPCPVYALGGLGPLDVEPVLRSGARGVAAISSVFAGGSCADAVRAFSAAFETAGGAA